MLFYVLTQSPETSFFRADRKFQLLVETMDAFHVLGTKQIENKGGYLGQIPEDIFHFSGEPFVFRAVGHNLSLRKTQVLVAPNRLQSHPAKPRPRPPTLRDVRSVPEVRGCTNDQRKWSGMTTHPSTRMRKLRRTLSRAVCFGRAGALLWKSGVLWNEQASCCGRAGLQARVNAPSKNMGL